MVYVWAMLLFVGNVLAWISTAFTLPGNWLILGFTVLYAWLLPAGMQPRISWTVVWVALGLAVLGEIVEFLAGAAGVAQQGGSRRGVVAAILGAIVGSLAGAAIAAPVPVVGPLIGALLGGSAGAFGGAYLGEMGTGRPHTERLAIGKGAFIGRLWGTAGKLIVGVIMLMLVTLDSFFDLASAN